MTRPALPDLPGLPDLPSLPDLPDIGTIGAEPLPNPFDALVYPEGVSTEDASAMEDKVIDDEFAAIREGRRQQREAIDLANESEYWFAVYFQTREQKEAFLKAMKWFEHGDKYLDGQFVAKKLGVTLPPRPAPYKVGRLDKKLSDLT